jgi:hypothetical protein
MKRRGVLKAVAMLDEPGLANHVECLISDGTKEALTNLTAAFCGAGAAVHCAMPRSGATVAIPTTNPSKMQIAKRVTSPTPTDESRLDH